MPNTTPCDTCIHYWAQMRPQPGNRPDKDLKHGHCLAKTIYAVNKPGKRVYPPGAKFKKLPYGRHRIFSVEKGQIISTCLEAKPTP